jgi:hypothetical protein
MPLGQVGPVILQVIGDAYTSPANITAIVWEGVTLEGDQVLLRHRGNNEELWPGRTDTTQTYLGISFAEGLKAPNGFWVSRIDSGKLRVYIKER